MNYFLHLTVMLEIYLLLAISANQIVGYSGLLSLGQAIFYGTGAYVTAIATINLGSYWVSLPLVLIACLLSALAVFYVSGRVRDLYFALSTLALQIIFFSLVYNWMTVTNGPYGISNITPPVLLGHRISSPGSFALFGALFLACVVLFYYWFVTTPVFRMIQAARDDQIGLLSLGKNPNYYKCISIVISAVISGLAGSLYAAYATYIDPSSFTLDESILILSIVLVGGIASVRGAIAGGLIFILLPELLKTLGMPDAIAANARMILFGLLLILIVRLRPEGLFGKRVLQ